MCCWLWEISACVKVLLLRSSKPLASLCFLSSVCVSQGDEGPRGLPGLVVSFSHTSEIFSFNCPCSKFSLIWEFFTGTYWCQRTVWSRWPCRRKGSFKQRSLLCNNHTNIKMKPCWNFHFGCFLFTGLPRWHRSSRATGSNGLWSSRVSGRI